MHELYFEQARDAPKCLGSFYGPSTLIMINLLGYSRWEGTQKQVQILSLRISTVTIISASGNDEVAFVNQHSI